MKYQAIIFDMDGTITDTEELWLHAFKEMLAQRNVSLSKDDQEALLDDVTGMGLDQKCIALKEGAGLTDSIEVLAREKLDIAKKLYQQHIKLMDGFPEFHAKLKKLGLKTAVATNADDETLEITHKALNLEQFFGEHIYGISRVNNMGKPNPAIYELAARKLGVDPRACIAIEDSAHGVNAARAAGMFCIGFNAAGKDKQVERAHMKVRSFGDIDLDGLLAGDKQA